MILLLISLAALAIGPLIYRVADKARSSLVALDGFVVVGVAGLVLVHIVPHSLESAGAWALLPALLGFLGPGLAERALHRSADKAHAAAQMIALGGLMVHAFFDGTALAAPSPHGGDDVSVLALAVVLHRLPIAITIWSLLVPTAGPRIATATLIGQGVATVLGYGLGGEVLHAESHWVAYFEALVAGSLLHVIIHRPTLAKTANARQRMYAGAAGIAAAITVAMFAEAHLAPQPGHATLPFGSTFMALMLETAPALLVAFALAGLVQVFMPQATLRWLRRGSPLGQTARGMAFGLPLPICSCGVIPLYHTMIKRGVPATAAMAFLVATPELGLDAVLISLPLLGADMTVARVVCAVIVAMLAGWVVGRMIAQRVPEAPGDLEPVAPGSMMARVRAGLRFGFGEIVDHTGPWLLAGLAIAALAAPLVKGEWLAALPWGTDIVLFAVLAMPLYVCASGATPLAAVLIFKGVSPGAAIAFLLVGPATNITTFGVLRDLHGARVAAAFGGVIAATAIGLGFAVNLIIGTTWAMPLGEAVHEEGSVLEIASLMILTVVFLLSVLRQGPRSFLDQVLAPYGSDPHDHDHGDHDHGDHDHGDHDHDHAPARGTGGAGEGCC
ncbi:MAG TPA: permease [Kofleriaceae bacterium]|nr:permease [Kofleriaceae bacterium]